jgi:leucyl aminopeptidase (aminopeptidase T)
MNPALIEIMKSIRIPLELNAQAGDKILIITDTRTSPDVWGAMAAAANELGMEPTITIMTPRAAHGYDPTSPVMHAAMDPDLKLVVYLTSTALAHCTLTTRLNGLGRKFILMEEVVPEMLLQGGPGYTDSAAMMALGDQITSIWQQGKTVRVLSDLGTDLTASIEGRPALTEAGKIRIPPDKIGKMPSGCAFPCGESNTCPLEGSGEGTIVFDLTAHSVGALKEPIRLTVKKGMVTNIEGGAEAARWREILEKHGDPNSYNCPAEISIGLNPNVRPTGSMRTDKKMYASCHIGVGDTITLGGTCHAKLRLEGVIKQPTIIVDGRTLTKGGRILIDQAATATGK